MKRIIIVDDDPGLRDAYGAILNENEYQLVFYSDAMPVLNHEFERPDLFLLDKQLSGVDGLDVCRFLKNDKETSDIPIIMLSASPAIERLAADAGADFALEKPFNINALREMVNNCLPK
ncbi:response regulator [Taibaiella soli]|uniref:Response regulator n=1 Tax=Taibaiella soli TaxID=1649169 RepID=A0A2W2B748_9BACT|nr:response regulator [Taibaiella soli]PZF71837.1 response regulator [Taibaiella soli]